MLSRLVAVDHSLPRAPVYLGPTATYTSRRLQLFQPPPPLASWTVGTTVHTRINLSNYEPPHQPSVLRTIPRLFRRTPSIHRHIGYLETVCEMFKLLSGSTSSNRTVRVQWLSRTAGFANASVESVIRKASEHFGLRSTQSDLILLAKVDGSELEVTNDILRTLPKGTILTLSRIEREDEPRPPQTKGSEKP
ncbi:hypothetical protein LXA43DRAFT_374881 [Ganoderma leucocontextum]|nr:hypothetical protein LXA43DRAFT_374881 [Ganoderma leucocontextum]